MFFSHQESCSHVDILTGRPYLERFEDDYDEEHPVVYDLAGLQTFLRGRSASHTFHFAFDQLGSFDYSDYDPQDLEFLVEILDEHKPWIYSLSFDFFFTEKLDEEDLRVIREIVTACGQLCRLRMDAVPLVMEAAIRPSMVETLALDVCNVDGNLKRPGTTVTDITKALAPLAENLPNLDLFAFQNDGSVTPQDLTALLKAAKPFKNVQLELAIRNSISPSSNALTQPAAMLQWTNAITAFPPQSFELRVSGWQDDSQDTIHVHPDAIFRLYQGLGQAKFEENEFLLQGTGLLARLANFSRLVNALPQLSTTSFLAAEEASADVVWSAQQQDECLSALHKNQTLLKFAVSKGLCACCRVSLFDDQHQDDVAAILKRNKMIRSVKKSIEADKKWFVDCNAASPTKKQKLDPQTLGVRWSKIFTTALFAQNERDSQKEISVCFAAGPTPVYLAVQHIVALQYGRNLWLNGKNCGAR